MESDPGRCRGCLRPGSGDPRPARGTIRRRPGVAGVRAGGRVAAGRPGGRPATGSSPPAGAPVGRARLPARWPSSPAPPPPWPWSPPCSISTPSVVFVTPVVIHAARSRGQAEVPLVIGCLLLSNTGSLLLPGSNLTNLIVLGQLPSGRWAVPRARMAVPWAASVLVTAGVDGPRSSGGRCGPGSEAATGGDGAKRRRRSDPHRWPSGWEHGGGGRGRRARGGAPVAGVAGGWVWVMVVTCPSGCRHPSGSPHRQGPTGSSGCRSWSGCSVIATDPRDARPGLVGPGDTARPPRQRGDGGGCRRRKRAGEQSPGGVDSCRPGTGPPIRPSCGAGHRAEPVRDRLAGLDPLVAHGPSFRIGSTRRPRHRPSGW
jgi:hypothetical protein